MTLFQCRQRLVALTFTVAIFLATCAQAETYHVDPNGSDAANGLGWRNDPIAGNRPFKTLTKAIEVAAGNGQVDLIKVAKGTYLPSSTGDETASFSLVPQCVIQGGYEGGTTNPDLRLPANYALTILSGDLSGNDAGTAFDPTLTADNSDHVVLASGVGDSAVLEGLTIINGCGIDTAVELNATLGCWDGQVPAKEGGAAIDCIQGSPDIRFCTFRHNWSRLGGAVRLLCQSDPRIVGCVFDDNWAYQDVPSIPEVFGSGGGLYMQAYCDPFVFNCTFKDNRAVHIGGGCAAQNEAVPTFVNCLFLDNDCEEMGGGYRSGFEAESTLVNCTFRGNNAATGGGISLNRVDHEPPPPSTGLKIALHNCLVWGNDADIDGDEIFVQNGDLGTVKAWNCDVRATSGAISGPVVWATPNLDADPGYDADSRPSFASLTLNQGDPAVSILLIDLGDVDDDNLTAEALPIDATAGSRRVNPIDRIDIGALENQHDSCVGDIAANLNGGPDGSVDSADLSTLLARWGTPGGVADLAPTGGDGLVDAQDLTLLLGAWGPCPSQGMMMMSESSAESGGPTSPSEVAAMMGFASLGEFVAWLDGLGFEAMSAVLQAFFPE